MMWRFIKTTLVLASLFRLIFSCAEKHKKTNFTKTKLGYWYRLLSFNSDSVCAPHSKIARVSATFKTQRDSVFWDSHNNVNDNFFMQLDSTATKNVFKRHVSLCCLLDSVCLLVPVRDFYAKQFQSDSIPFFSEGDSVVQINFKITELLSVKDFENKLFNFKKNEEQEIEDFFKSPTLLEAAIDPNGFYWLDRPAENDALPITSGDLVKISYQGHFLNGRFFEKSNEFFEFIYGTPDQLLKGLNYALASLKNGQTAKILLPSRLAFGEIGSSNGFVPPYTPLIYEVKIIDVKKIK